MLVLFEIFEAFENLEADFEYFFYCLIIENWEDGPKGCKTGNGILFADGVVVEDLELELEEDCLEEGFEDGGLSPVLDEVCEGCYPMSSYPLDGVIESLHHKWH